MADANIERRLKALEAELAELRRIVTDALDQVQAHRASAPRQP